MDNKRLDPLAPFFGISRTVVDFTCKGTGKRCTAYVDCGSVGIQALISWTFASIEFETVGTGSTASGFFSSEELASRFTSFGPIIDVPLTLILGFSTQGNNLAFDLGVGAGIAYQGCFIRYLFCEN
jgi:hypothetical protein